MYLFLDSFWRAVAYCLHPRVIFLSLLPLVLMVLLSLGLGYFFWDVALDQVRGWMDSAPHIEMLWKWLEGMGMGGLRSVVVPLLVIFAVTPLIVMFSLLLVAFLMTPALVSLVVRNRFAGMEEKQGAGLASSLLWSLGSTMLAALALLISVPLWLVPPLVLLLPPLIWGWLTYRVMAFDALARHASKEERVQLFKRHSMWLLAIGVITGYLGASPTVIWALGAGGLAPAFILLVPLAIWIYMLIFAFASLWFCHFCLAALQIQRVQAMVATPAPSVAPADSPSAPADMVVKEET